MKITIENLSASIYQAFMVINAVANTTGQEGAAARELLKAIATNEGINILSLIFLSAGTTTHSHVMFLIATEKAFPGLILTLHKNEIEETLNSFKS